LNNFLGMEINVVITYIKKMNLTYLKECIDEAHPKAYTNITADKYPDKGLKKIRLKNN